MSKRNKTQQRAQVKKQIQAHDGQKSQAPAAATAEQSGTAYWQKMAALPMHVRTMTKLRRAAERLAEYAKQSERFDGKAVALAPPGEAVTTPSALVAIAEGSIAQAITMLERIPGDYEPPRKLAGAAAGRRFSPGTMVRINEKNRPKYIDDLTVADLEQLKVLEVRKHRVVCATASGAKLFVPAAHLMVVQVETEVAAGRQEAL